MNYCKKNYFLQKSFKLLLGHNDPGKENGNAGHIRRVGLTVPSDVFLAGFQRLNVDGVGCAVRVVREVEVLGLLGSQVERRAREPYRGNTGRGDGDQQSHAEHTGPLHPETSSEERKGGGSRNSDQGGERHETSEQRLVDALHEDEAPGDVVEAEHGHVEEGETKTGEDGGMVEVG